MLGNDVGEGLTIVEMIAVKAIRLGDGEEEKEMWFGKRRSLGEDEILGI
jgi:hypothetical protein